MHCLFDQIFKKLSIAKMNWNHLEVPTFSCWCCTAEINDLKKFVALRLRVDVHNLTCQSPARCLGARKQR